MMYYTLVRPDYMDSIISSVVDEANEEDDEEEVFDDYPRSDIIMDCIEALNKNKNMISKLLKYDDVNNKVHNCSQ